MPVYSAKNAKVSFNGQQFSVKEWRPVPALNAVAEVSLEEDEPPFCPQRWTFTVAIENAWVNRRYLKWLFNRPKPRRNRRWRRRQAYREQVAWTQRLAIEKRCYNES